MASFGEGNAVKDLWWALAIATLAALVWIMSATPAKLSSPGSTASSTVASTTTATSTATTTSFWSGVKKWLSAPTTKNLTPVSTAEDTSTVTSSKNTSQTGSATNNQKTGASAAQSTYAGQVTITLGRSGEDTGDIAEEYVVLKASSNNKQAIVISGWQIDNGKSAKTFLINNTKVVHYASTRVTIPQAVKLLTGASTDQKNPVLLAPGETAYVITGAVRVQGDYALGSGFKTNKCSGYLNKLPHYGFTPSIYGSCPKYNLEITSIIPDACLTAVKRYGTSCLTPSTSYNDDHEELLNGYKDVPTACKKLIFANFSYGLCVAKHQNDSDFYGSKWYLYLQQNSFPLYADDGVTLTLYDSAGKIVDTYSY